MKKVFTEKNGATFTVDYDKQRITFVQSYMGSKVIGRADCKEKVFDIPFGMALAYAKAELEVRECEYVRATNYYANLVDISFDSYEGDRSYRLADKVQRIVSDEIKVQSHYLNNQIRLVKFLQNLDPSKADSTPFFATDDYHKVLKLAFSCVKK